MPVQINEVIIRAVVDDKPVTSPSQTNTTNGSNMVLQEELLEKILEIIKEKGER